MKCSKEKNIRINKDMLLINQPKNNRYVSDKPKQGESFNHITHKRRRKGDSSTRNSGLCDCKFYGHYASHMEDHYLRRHHSKALKIYNCILLRCKCKDVLYRGLDNYKRNNHWHCPECHKPVNDRKQFTQHLGQRQLP